MPLVEFACDGQLLFTVEASKRLGMLPRIGEALVVEEARYVVVDVEYGARRAGDPQRRELWPVVHVRALDPEAWAQRLERRQPGAEHATPPVRY
ncbi:MAG: hypothetical protein ACPHRO_00195 [Nannocystaceae bacterium]